jgi:uncharacterized protein
MIRWVCIFDDAPEMRAIRSTGQVSHQTYLAQNADKILRAGTLTPHHGGSPTGALWILNVASREHAVSLIENDPCFEPLHRSYRLYEWIWPLKYPADVASDGLLQP